MFLRPQQLQAGQRFAAAAARDGDKVDHYYNWGLRSVDLNREALASYRLEVRALQARFRDGTVVSIPDDLTLSPVDLRAALERQQAVTAYLAIPIFHSGRPNVGSPANGETSRYQAVEQPLDDESTGLNPQPVQLLVPNVRLLLSTDSREGYEVLEIARVLRMGTATALPKIDPHYFPPVLSTRAWPELQQRVDSFYHFINGRIDQLAGFLVRAGVPVDSFSPEDARLVIPLQVLNEAYALLHVLAFAEGVHPLVTYYELSRLLGRLSVYGRERRCPAVPQYDHDDLAGCYIRVLDLLYELVKPFGPPPWQKLPFVGAGVMLEASPILQEWLLPSHQMYVGVGSETLAPEDVNRLLTGTGRDALSMKIASSERVEDIFRMGLRGLSFRHEPNPPRLPSSHQLTFFHISRDPRDPALESEWQYVVNSGKLALRLNEKEIAEIHGQTTLRLKNRPGDLTFWIYVL
jgi:type VI secretion system protein ImpJ